MKRPVVLLSALLGALLCAGCGNMDFLLVTVKVTGISDEIQVLEVDSTLGDRKLNTERFEGSKEFFGLELPAGSRERLHLEVRGLSGAPCLIALGQGGVELGGGAEVDLHSGQRRYDVQIDLGRVDPPVCGLEVKKAGTGTGTVSSVPAGIDCGPACSSPLQAGQVVLRARPDPRSYFVRWESGCAGEDPTCEVSLQAPLQVTARFAPKICSQDDWCWDNPLPQGNTLRAAWASSEKDVWAVGDHGTVIRWDGEEWTREEIGTTADLLAISGCGDGKMLIAGKGSTLYVREREGAGFMSQNPHWDSNRQMDLMGAWGCGERAFVVGSKGLILRRRHQSGQPYWTQEPSPPSPPLTSSNLNAIWGGGAEAWAVGDGGAVLHLQGDTWSAWQQWGGAAPTEKLNAVWGSSASDVWVVGDKGGVLHYTGAWSRETITAGNLYAVAGHDEQVWIGGEAGQIWRRYMGRWIRAELVNQRILGLAGGGPDGPWAVGEAGLIAAPHGGSWQLVRKGTTQPLSGIHGDGDLIYSVGSGVFVRWDGARWVDTPIQGGLTLTSVWGNAGAFWSGAADGSIRRLPDVTHPEGEALGVAQSTKAVWGSSVEDVWAVGGRATVRRRTGGRWAMEDLSGQIDVTNRPSLNGVSGTGANSVWVVGGAQTGEVEHAIILRYDGRWRQEPGVQPFSWLNSLWCSGDEVFAVGASWTVLRRDPITAAWGRVGLELSPQEQSQQIGLNTVWGTDNGPIWVGGAKGYIFRVHKQEVFREESGTNNSLFRLWGRGEDVWGVGPNGMILRRISR